jgi:hypothetical protein
MTRPPDSRPAALESYRSYLRLLADRFQSAGEVADLLEHHLARLQNPSLPPVEHPWRRRPSRLAALGRDLTRRAGAGRLAIPLLLLAVAAGSAAWTQWALQVPPGAIDPAPRLSDRLKAAWEYRCDDTIEKQPRDGNRLNKAAGLTNW